MDLRTDPEHADLLGVSLCAGYGGLDLGLHIAQPGYRTVCYVERESHAAATLVARMADQALDQAPIWSDLATFDGRPWRGRVHLVAAGYPCQPFSVAGDRRGAEDPRHLWPHVRRIIGEIEPRWVFLENVEGHFHLGFPDVARELCSLGYGVKAGLFTAREVGASHLRRRLFIVAYADRSGRGLCARSDGGGGTASLHETVGDRRPQRRAILIGQRGAGLEPDMAAREGTWLATERGPSAPLFAPGPGELRAWEALIDGRPDLEPAILRTDDGLADRLDRTRGAGNGVCSLAAALAWRTLSADFGAGLAAV